MKNLWAGEEAVRKQPLRREQGDYNLDKDLFESGDMNIAEACASRALEPASFDFLQDKARGESPFQTSEVEVPSGQPPDASSGPVLREYLLRREMAPIVGKYQHERSENLDEYFKALGVPYIPRKMMGMSNPRVDITNEGEKWTISTSSIMRSINMTFMLGEEYEETIPNGDTLKNVTTMEDDSLVTVSVGPDNNKVVRKYEFTDDGMVLTMTHESSGQVAKRYFKRLP